MGQPVSILAPHGPSWAASSSSSAASSSASAAPPATGRNNARVTVLPPCYLPLCDNVKAGDASASVTATNDDVKDALSKILEFGPALRFLPKEPETATGGSGSSLMAQNLDQQLHEILSSVDTTNELFQYVSSLAALSPETGAGAQADVSVSGGFDGRVASYVKSLQNLYQLTKKEKQRYEQRLQTTRMQATSQRKVTPPPLPLPTQNCMTMGWEIVVHLLKATRAENPTHYLQALQMMKDNLRTLKPTTYGDSMYLAPSASASFNALSECLSSMARPLEGKDQAVETSLGATTIETLAEVALARGSLTTLLTVVLWLFDQPPSTEVDLGPTLSKLAGLKEQQLYGKCEASGELYCCGQNSYGELGIGDDIERHQLTSVSLCGWEDIRQVVSGNEVLAILTNGGVVLTCGLNKSGQCGHGHFDERVMLLRPVQALRSQKIKYIAASNGCEHMIALTETGLAYSWGYNDRGQLGHENLTTKIHLPKLIESLKDKKVNYAAVSYHHSAVVTDTGELYTFGMNDCGQLGLDHTQHMGTSQLVKALEGHEVSMVACGLYHTIVCTAAGELFAFGKNDYGQLGLGHSRQIKLPALVPLPNEMVCFVACGYYHSVVVTTTGHTYSFGRNDYGQLGVGSKIHQNVPTVVALSASTRMIRATCGCYHSVLLSEQGQVFVFGRNNKGQLGNRSSADSLLPVPLKVRPEKSSRRCIDVAAGFYTTSLIYERKKENEEGDAIVLDQNCLISVCGRVDIDRSGEIEGLSNFGSVSTVGITLFEGKWFYEVEVVSCGLIQIGWIDNYFQGSSDQGEGVGDHTHSWSYDGNRQRRWNSGSSSYGEKWKAGDVIGCLLDLGANEMTFFRNGIDLGVAFTDIKCDPADRRLGLMPGISLERGEIIRVNLGHQPFAHPPTTVGEFDAVCKAMALPTGAATLKYASSEVTELRPPAVEGSATVSVKDKVFVIGGAPKIAAENSEASNQVWVYHQDTKRWERWADFPIGIRNHQAVAIGDDTILVIGGENTTPTSRHMDLYKCSTAKGADGSLPVWELVQSAVGATNALPAPRAHHVASIIRVRLDAMVFVYGGKSAENETLGDVWYLSLEDFSWSRLPSSISLDPGPRSGCSTAVIGENVFLFGGQDKEEKLRADLWRYNTFDRVWHLCHDDNIAAIQDASSDSSALDHGARGDFSPVVPDARVNYSICADFGNVWVYGGIAQSGALLRDMWCYNVTSQKWSCVEISSDEDVEGSASATLVIPQGTSTALPAASVDGALSGRVSSQMLLVGGVSRSGDINGLANRVREFVAADSARSFTADPAKSMATSGKSSLILGTLRAKCTVGTGRTYQQCVPLAMDSGVCVLSHLDRLAGNELPADDTDAIQLSRCSYRSLCVDPKEQTFAALHSLLHKLSTALRTDFQSSEASGVGSAIVTNVLYPILVVIRLLKLNFFELVRSGIDPAEVGMHPASTHPSGTLSSLRELLFGIAEQSPAVQPVGEVAWFYRAVKQETAATIYHGFSILFPSLLDRIEVMNKLMQESTNADPMKKLLVPMLVPCFTSPKMMFQLMADTPSSAVQCDEKTSQAPEIMAEFASTLLESLWAKTNAVLDCADAFSDPSALMKKLGDLDTVNEFKCLNVLLRAAVYWCSHSIEHGWPILLSISVKLATFFGQLLGRGANMLPHQVSLLPSILQNSFAGKLLPFVILSVGSLPSVREAFSDVFKPFWPHLEVLLTRVHSVLSNVQVKYPDPSSMIRCDGESSSSVSASQPDSLDLNAGGHVRMSSELASIVQLPAMTPLTFQDAMRAIWKKALTSETVHVKKVTGSSIGGGGEVNRIWLPADLAKLFGSATLTFSLPRGVDLPKEVASLRQLDVATLSFQPSGMILSQHLHLERDGEPAQVVSTSTVLPPAAPPQQNRRASALVGATSFQWTSEASVAWLQDLHKVLIWLGSHFASALVIGSTVTGEQQDLDPRWMQSPLLRGGLDGNEGTNKTPPDRLSDIENEQTRNNLLLQQIVAGVGAGKNLVEKVKFALDPGSSSTLGGSNPKLFAARLKRQDSVEAALEKSGHIEAVDKAVRIAFAALLKHSNTAYVNGGILKDGTPSEAVVDAWRSALQLRRWIVREQQKLASERTNADANSTEVSMKERQTSLYNAVCEPVIRRGQLLLKLAAVPSSAPSLAATGLKLLPGLSTTNFYEVHKPSSNNGGPLEESSDDNEQVTQQLKSLMEAKTMEVVEEEDERIQSDIFAFLQYSGKPKSAPAEGEDARKLPVSNDLDDRVLAILKTHQQRGQERFEGLQIFSQLLACTESNPSCRLNVIPALSTAFKRLVRQGDGVEAAVAIEKVHYLEDLEFIGPQLAEKVRGEFFTLLTNLLGVACDHIGGIRSLIETGAAGSQQMRTLSSHVHHVVHEVMQIFEACSIPYRGEDWEHIDQINFLPLITELSSWRSWKMTTQLEFPEDPRSDSSSAERYPILAAGIAHRIPKIICAKAITIGTDLHQLTLSSSQGGLSVFHHPFYRGRWYWEVSVVAQSDQPVFVGVCSSADDLNQPRPSVQHGVFVYDEPAGADDDPGAHGQNLYSRMGCIIGVVLDCDEKKLEFYVDSKRVKVVVLDSKKAFPGNLGMFPAIGIEDAEVFWNLLAPVPDKLWASCNAFRFSAPVVSGCLVASPIDGTYISMDAKSKGHQLRLSADGTTVIAGDFSSSDELFETIVANQGFEGKQLFIELQVLSGGRDGRCDLSFGIVSSDFDAFETGLKQQAVAVRCAMPDEAFAWGSFGVLYDFAKGKVTVYPSTGEPLSRSIDVAKMKYPLLPAISALCNGLVFRVNFHPRNRPELLANAIRVPSVGENCHVSSANDIQIGKVLQMQVHSCDGGEFSSSHAARNCLVDDASVYSSAKGRNINLVLRHEVDTPFSASYLTIRGAGPGYSSSLRHAAVFVTSSVPDLRRLQDYDDLTPEEFASLPFPTASLRSDRNEYLPVAYFVLDGSCAQVAKQLAVPVQGRYVVIKLLCPALGSNIDVGYIGVCGTFDKDNGPAYAENAVTVSVCEECRTSPLHGVYYSLKDDEAVKICAACYDDNRGSLQVSYFAHVGVDVDGQSDDGFALCVPRKASVDRLVTQLSTIKRPKFANSVGVPSSDSSPNGVLSTGASRAIKPERSLAWFDDCELFSCGQNNYGELCLGHCNSTSKLEHVPFFSTKSVRDIVGGNEVLAVLMKDGAVFTCGLNKSGQCGNGTFEERVLVASPVRGLSGIPIGMVAAANGCEHMIAVAADGSVYSWGYNDRGQLGLGSTISKSHTPRLIESLREKYVATSAAVSYHHSAVVTSAGELLTFGMNDCGQLGLDHTQHQHTPQLVDALSSQVVTRVACGLYHTVCVTAGGELYACGKNDYGQLGLGHARNVKVPTLVRVTIGDSDEKIVDVSCGYYHTVAITDKGKLITWGRNDYGQLGIGSKDHKNTPQYVPLPLSSRIRKSSCGCYHTLILLANGRVMVFGRNNKGQLGAGARTLPSADLPLPIPLNSLSHDEVSCIAAGFYSSYILTGRSSQTRDPERDKDDHAQAKDLAERNSSEALYESLMKEIDRNQHSDAIVKAAPIQMKRGNMHRKLPLLKLHAASWAMLRALLYQSLNDGRKGTQSKSGKRDGVLRSLVVFLLDNLNELQAEITKETSSSLQTMGSRLDAFVAMKNACVGLLTLCVRRSQVGAPTGLNVREPPVQALYPHFFRNQVLCVLLSCGSADVELCSVLASNDDVLTEILKGMMASDLSSATICIRLAMLVFPFHSVSYVNAAYRKLQGSTTSPSVDILTVLMLLVGNPLVLRPRLCRHELGIERSCSTLCESAKCLKGLSSVEDTGKGFVIEDLLEQSHVAASKGAEVVGLLRYLTLYPTWKVAVNASMSKAFARTDKLSEILDTVCAYYASIENPPLDADDLPAVEPVESVQLNETSAQQNSVRKPEATTASPEVDESTPSDNADDDEDKQDDGECTSAETLRDKKALLVWQKAKDALDGLAAILAAVSIVGGNVETPREGSLGVIEDPDHKSCGKMGVLSGIKRDTRGDLVASVMLVDHQRAPVWQPLQQGATNCGNVPVKFIKPVERVPSLLQMFDAVDGVIGSLSLLVLPCTDDSSVYSELEQPHNNQVQVILGRRMRMYTKQIQWRAALALSTLLKQMPRLSPVLINTDTQLLSNIAQTIANEDGLKQASLLSSLKSGGVASSVVDLLHIRWVGVKQRQIRLEAERVVDDAVDRYEADSRDQVVRKLGQQNALSWGMDAIQSPRKGSAPSSVLNSRTQAGSTNGPPRSDGGRATGNALPHGVWGVLHPLPPLNENETPGGPSAQPQAIDYTPFHLTTPIVRVGRAADSCDLIVNDRSVSGRHFHLRRVRRENEGVTEDYFELQDFSKNGTIVNGVRVHGTSVRVTPGSRISLILSRGGLVTYEFQVRQSHGAGAHGAAAFMSRMAPPPIITAPQSQQETNVAIQGQEYQQPLSANGPAPVEPRSPAEMQNRGGRQQSMDSVRSRMPNPQGLRLITSISESEVPRALISPNPAVESPRVGGFSSPRSSILQAPGTPAVATPTANLFNALGPEAVLSPASYQQRESSALGLETSSVRTPEITTGGGNDGLRIALGRDSITRESGHRNSLQGATLEPSRMKTFGEFSDSAPVLMESSPAVELLARLRGVGLLQVALEQCEEAIHAMDGDIHSAFTVLHEQLSSEQAHNHVDLTSPTVQHLANLLAKDVTVCAEALRRTQQNVAAAVRLLLSPAGAELEQAFSSAKTSHRLSFQPSSVEIVESAALSNIADGLINLQEIMDENPSYALAESSAVLQATRARPSSPTKSKAPDAAKFTQSQLGLWVECAGQVDERLNQMNTAEIDDEEAALCGLLTAVHSRKLLEQVVRLFTDVPDQADNMLAAFGDPLTLRQLILFPPASSEQVKSGSRAVVAIQSEGAETTSDDGSIQRILTRSADETFTSSTANTLRENMVAVQNLSSLCLAIDQRDCWSKSSSSQGVLPQLLRTLLMYEARALKLDGSGLLHQTNIMHNLVVDTLLHTLSRTFVNHGSLLNWEAAMTKSRRPEMLYPKGPIRLSCGIECVVVASYDRVWSVPSPDPLLQFRHKWRKRDAPGLGSRAPEPWIKSMPDGYVTIWRPVVPSGVNLQQPSTWFALGDVLQMGGDVPDRPVLMVRDDGSGNLLAPVGFERVDVTGKGLPKNSDNDPDFQRKQVRSLWWPIAPPGYIAFGCVAGGKEDPFQPPALASVRCIREDLMRRADSYSCMWRAETRMFGPPTLLKALDRAGGNSGDGRRNQQTESLSVLEMAADEVCVRTSLWSVDMDFSRTILPVITIDGEPSEAVTVSTISMTLEDKILCAPMTVANAMSFVSVMLECQKSLASTKTTEIVGSGDHDKPLVLSAIRPELCAALFELLKQVLREKLPGSGQTAVALVRALIRLIQNGGKWKDKNGLLYCRSKIIILQQDQEAGNLMLHSLLQAFVELMLVVDEQNRVQRVQELTSYLDKDGKSTIHLPYRFNFARGDAHKEMLVSHSSKMAVTRHFSGEERKFLLEYQSEDAENADAATPLETPVLDCFSCRFEHTPELVITLKDELKAEIVYFELTILEWSNVCSSSSGIFGFGMSPPDFPLEGPAVGMNTNSTSTYSFTPVSGKVHTSDICADQWRWNDQVAAVAIGDVFGCGLRLDTREIFFTKNGRLLGTAFSLPGAGIHQLHPTVSVSAGCKFLINFGSSGSAGDMFASKVNFAFRFNTMDYDNLMSGFEWYEQLSQVYGVMQALMDPARDSSSEGVDATGPARGALLPDEFMLSADNFLSEVSQDVCIHVESAHPYDLELQEALVSIPLATSIRVKLDAQCETANSHCLQILQGGDGTENSGTESEVRAFTGACGSQEVMIEGDSFVWRFPVQSNFQCRVDRVRKGPYLKLENRDTRLSLTRDKGWQTAIGVARVDSGIHIWEVRITFVTASSNIFLGIARRDVRLDSYLGKDNRGWGWIGNRALWHNGSKQRGTYGEKFKTGDVVRMTLDLKRGTLSYALNGKDLGVAFGPGGVGPKLEGTFYPGFALYNQRDSLDLIGGHRVEDGDTLLSSGSGVTRLLPGSVGDEAYYSEDDEEALAVDVDDGIPNFRMELATALSQMGFPMDWCVYALRHCEDDAEQAADFILANMHVMEALVREEAEAHSRRLRHREALAAAAATAGTISASSAPVSADVGSDSGVLAGENADADVHSTSDADALMASGGIDDSSIPGFNDPSAPISVDKWGIAFTAVPEFSVTGRRLLAHKYASKLQQLHASQAVFGAEHDNAIVQIVNEICEARAEALLSCDPLRMAPEEFVPNEEHSRRFPCVSGIPLAQLQKRFLILRNFNCRLQNSLSFIDFSVNDEQSVLARGTRSLRGVIFQHVKLAWWLNILKEQQSPAAARPEIEVDRHRAREATETTGPKESVFAQCFEQLHSIQPSLLRGADRAFKCQFVGEFGDDFGGLYRECIAQISAELQSNVLPLFLPCPNAMAAVGDNRDKFVPNVHVRGDARLVQMAEFLGKLIGIAIRTKTPLDLNLPPVFWKTLVGQLVTRRDIESIHQGSFQVVDAIDNITTHGITEGMFDEIIDANFTVLSSARQPIDLVPGGRCVRVLWDDKEDYARAVGTFRLTEFAPVIQDILRGLSTILPAPTIGLFAWHEFASLVCGKATVDIELLRRRTIYGDGCQATDPHIAFFWDVLGEFTDEQKSSFLRFVWGRSRLPTHAADFTQDFKISGLPKAAGRPDTYLPIAHTCFFSIDLPNYTCRDVMKERLLYAITHCLSIDADNTTVAQRAGQGLNWTATTTTTATAATMTNATAALAAAAASATASATSAAVATAAAAVSSVIAGLSAAMNE